MPNLVTFSNPSHTATGVYGEIDWKAGGLEIQFSLSSPLASLLDGPPLSPRSFGARELNREDGLWKTTCFEAFFGIPGDSAYWEVNLAAKGAWNLYRFDSYRRPQPPQPCEDFRVAALNTGPGFLRCRLEPKKKLTGPALEASLCLVARTDHGIEYFSTRHAGAKPDFHLRSSFTLVLTPAVSLP